MKRKETYTTTSASIPEPSLTVLNTTFNCASVVQSIKFAGSYSSAVNVKE